jgi:hypothetical protein
VQVRVKIGSLARSSEDDPEHCLTELRDYFVLGVDEVSLRVVSDDGEPALYPKHLFNVLDHSLPPDWRFDDFEDGAYRVVPKLVSRRGFYEDYFGSDGDRAAEVAAHAVVRTVLEAARDWGTDADRLVIDADLHRMLKRQRKAIERPGYRW